MAKPVVKKKSAVPKRAVKKAEKPAAKKHDTKPPVKKVSSKPVPRRGRVKQSVKAVAVSPKAVKLKDTSSITVATAPPAPLKIMVASTIYGFEDNLEQICITLKQYGYEVWNSHMKTIPVHPGWSNEKNCLEAVKKCDLFFGIIRPRYGSGVVGATSITHQEMVTAIALNKPRWYIAHRDIGVARQLLKQYMYNGKKKAKGFSYQPTGIIDDIRVIDLYNETIKNDLPVEKRRGHWIDEFYKIGDILQCVKTQFADVDRVREIVDDMKKEIGA